MSTSKKLMQRLAEGETLVVDGGYVVALERRGYVQAGPYTPEVVIEHPDAVRQIHREFARAGSDILQALTFYCSDDKLQHNGHNANEKFGSELITREACRLAKEVASEYGGLLVSASISQTPSYAQGKGEQVVKDLVRKQVKVHKEEGVDLIIVEYFIYNEEICWCIEAAKEFGLPVAATMCIGPEGDANDVSAADCAVRMAKAGADILGTNCHYDPYCSLTTMKLMKDGLVQHGLEAHLMCQPLGYMTQDLTSNLGYYAIAEFPLAMESRLCNRFDFAKFARDAFDLGIRVLGGCCGADAVHVRAIAEELAAERNRIPAASTKSPNLALSARAEINERAGRDYWMQLKRPNSGRVPASNGIHLS